MGGVYFCCDTARPSSIRIVLYYSFNEYFMVGKLNNYCIM
jgi:hypothetical protein